MTNSSKVHSETLHFSDFQPKKETFSPQESQKIQDITTRAEACANDIITPACDYVPGNTQVIRHYYHNDSWLWRPYGYGRNRVHHHHHHCNPATSSTTQTTKSNAPASSSGKKEKKKDSEVGVAILVAGLAALGISLYSAAKISAQKVAAGAATKMLQRDVAWVDGIKQTQPHSKCLKALASITKKESQIIGRVNARLTREVTATALLALAGTAGVGSYVSQEWQVAYGAGVLGATALATWVFSWYKNHGEGESNRVDARAIVSTATTLREMKFQG